MYINHLILYTKELIKSTDELVASWLFWQLPPIVYIIPYCLMKWMFQPQ